MTESPKPPIGGTSLSDKILAEMSYVSLRTFERVKVAVAYGIPEVQKAMKNGVNLSAVQWERIGRLPEDRQLAELQRVMNEPKPKRQPPSVEKDVNDIQALINQRAKRWTKEDAQDVAIVLRGWADELIGLGGDDEGDE